MRILVFNWQDIRNPNSGGAEVHLHEIFRRIVAMGHSVTLFCSAFIGSAHEETIDGISIIRAGSRNLFNYLVPRRYASHFSNEKYDVVVDDVNKIPFYTPLYVREPVVGVLHHLFGRSIFKEVGWLPAAYVYGAERLALSVYRKTPFAVVSESTRKELLEAGFSSDRIMIVPNGVTMPNANLPDSIPPEPVVGHFGRLKKYKSVDHLLKAFVKVRERIPNAKLIIVGEGDHRITLEQISHKLGLDSVVNFTGYVDEATKNRLLINSTVVVNCSVKEGWGLTVLEANAFGVPVVASNVPGLRDSVVENRTGLLYDYGNIDQLADRIIALLTDKELRGRLSVEARRWAESFSWDRSADLMLELIEQTVARR